MRGVGIAAIASVCSRDSRHGTYLDDTGAASQNACRAAMLNTLLHFAMRCTQDFTCMYMYVAAVHGNVWQQNSHEGWMLHGGRR